MDAPEIAAEPAQKSSLTERLINVYAAPGEVFDEVKAAPASMLNWIVPLVLSMVVALIYIEVAFSQPAVMQGIREAQQKGIQQKVNEGAMTQAQADKAAEKVAEFTTPTLMKIFGGIGAIISNVAWLFFVALVIWVLSKWPMRSSFPYMKALETVALAGMVMVLGGIVGVLLVLWKGDMAVTLGPVLLLSKFDPSNLVHQILASLNVVTIWYVALLSLGLARLSGRNFAPAAACLFGLWLLLKAGQLGLTFAFHHAS